MEYHHYCRPLVCVAFISILPLIYTQNEPQDNVNVNNVARKEVGFYTKCGPTGGGGNKGDKPFDDGNATSQPQDFLNAHNAIRKEHGLGPIVWNTTLAEYAQNYANQRKDCVLKHSDSGGRYTESCAMGGTAQDALNMWHSEKKDWDPVTKTCAPGKECGHYLQVIANDGVQVGCGRVKCFNHPRAYFVTCNYWEPRR